MPIQTAENVSPVEEVTVGTFQDPVIAVTMDWGVCRSEATTYPAQFTAFEIVKLLVGVGVGVGVCVGVTVGVTVGVGDGVGVVVVGVGVDVGVDV